MTLCRRGIAAAAALFFWTGARAEDRPAWLSDAGALYPKAEYVTGIGEGPTQDKAADKARAEVAKSLSLTLSADTAVKAKEDSGSGFSQEVSDDVRTSTAKVLDGVEVVKYWRDEAGVTYALAVLQRGRSLAVLKDKLEEYDRNLAEWSAQLAKAEGKFARLRWALKLTQLAKARRRVNADYRSLNPEGKGIPAPEAFSQVSADARKAANALTIQVAADGQKAEAVAAGIIDALSSHGLRAVEKGDSPADLLIEAKSSGQPLPMEDLTWFWAKGTIAVKMSYGSTGEVFTRFEESGQQASRDPSSSVDAALSALTAKAAAHVYKIVLSGQIADD